MRVGGVITDNDPVEQERTAKFNALLTNAVTFHNAPDISEIVRRLQEKGHVVDPEDLAQISPYMTGHIRRFGEYSTHELRLEPEAYNPYLHVDFSLLCGDAPRAAGFGRPRKPPASPKAVADDVEVLAGREPSSSQPFLKTVTRPSGTGLLGTACHTTCMPPPDTDSA
ncbi:Tn3 family transposase [Streptomyces sp. NPDC056255]|uniref:Tn3 family transposase n=1 Tax=Streptomyces sp. NPDC056255 TaxID=3345764 RepID=UPI0035D8E1FE